MLNFYLYQNDAKIRILNTFNCLNVVMKYKIIQRYLKKLMINTIQKICKYNNLFSIIVTYNNFDLKKNKKKQTYK